MGISLDGEGLAGKVLACEAFAGELRLIVGPWEDSLGSDFFSTDSALLYLLFLGVT